MSREKFFSSLNKGFAFCDVVLGWDSNDEVYDNVTYTGWHTGYPDAPARIIPESCRELPFEENGLFFLCEFTEPADCICPRGVLQRVIKKAADMGFNAFGSLEYEFFVFKETPESIREKSYLNLEPLAPESFGYSIIRNTVEAEVYQEIIKVSEEMDFPIEGLHEETGPGVIEGAITVDNASDAADKGALFKTFIKIAMQRMGYMATFMAKWSSDWPGQSGHLHLSLQNLDGSSAFYDKAKEHDMSDTMRHYLAGQQKLMPEFLAMVSPTINSYSRMVPGSWAPTDASWGVENRTCALRVIKGGPKSQRVEYRIGAADGNPYLVMAAALASGLYGIEKKLEPEEMVVGNAYDIDFPDSLKLPTTLWDAAQRLKKSKAAHELFGSDFVNHFAATREWEEREFRKHVTDWELKRYFEII
jgi:glutamine synthetase